jgi:hypothetical protein
MRFWILCGLLIGASGALWLTLSGRPNPPPPPSPPPEPASFSYHDRPIHPGWVDELAGDLADPLAVVAAVDLEACERSNRFAGAEPTVENGLHQWRCSSESILEPFVDYRWIGCTPGGTHVLRTGVCGGGSGYFMNVLFVRIEQDQTYEDGAFRSRTLMKRVGSYTLGDRFDGRVELKGNRLFIEGRTHDGDAVGPIELIVP